MVLGYLLFRIWDLAIFWWVARDTGRTLVQILMSWDSGWYLNAARNGYPDIEAIGTSDEPVQTTWAWPPLYWMTARAVSYPLQVLVLGPLGQDSHSLSASLVLVNVTCGLLAAVVLYLAMRPVCGPAGAAILALLWAAGPASPIFVMAYTEGLMSLLLFAALWAVVHGRWVGASLLILGAALVKSSSPPFALALIIAVWIAHLTSRGPAVSRSRAVVTSAIAVLAAIAWPLIVAISFGRTGALAEVHAAWGRTSIPFRDTLAALASGPGNYLAQWYFSVVVVGIVSVTGILLVRDRRYPWYLRLSGPLLPAFVLFMSISLSAPRLLLLDLSLPVFEKKMVKGLASFVVLMLILAVVRSLWIILFPGGVTGDPAP